uniref:Uncharacterized protein n=1 Tax=Strigamia maritima TaxID=126957 RepID=T1JM95_STRMM
MTSSFLKWKKKSVHVNLLSIVWPVLIQNSRENVVSQDSISKNNPKTIPLLSEWEKRAKILGQSALWLFRAISAQYWADLATPYFYWRTCANGIWGQNHTATKT